MKNYTITVNGTVYEVSVEEGGAGSAPVRAAAPKAAPKAPAAAPAAAAPAASAGSIEVTASVPGKVFKVEAGDPIVILEAMKMEIPVVAPEDGTVAGINVSVGDAVESGDVLATMN